MSKMSIIEKCRELLNDRREFLKNGSNYKQYAALCNKVENSLSMKDKFEISKQLLKELEEYDAYYYAYDVTSFAEQWKTYFALLNSFHDYNGISREEFAFLLEKASCAIVAVAIGNDAFPIDFLIDTSFVERHQIHFNYWVIESCLNTAKQRRRKEIWDYYKSIVPGSENMTDEMILSIVGISFVPS
jgi:hypothetical protein